MRLIESYKTEIHSNFFVWYVFTMTGTFFYHFPWSTRIYNGYKCPNQKSKGINVFLIFFGSFYSLNRIQAQIKTEIKDIILKIDIVCWGFLCIVCVCMYDIMLLFIAIVFSVLWKVNHSMSFQYSSLLCMCLNIIFNIIFNTTVCESGGLHKTTIIKTTW